MCVHMCLCVCDIVPPEARPFVDCQILSTLGGRFIITFPFSHSFSKFVFNKLIRWLLWVWSWYWAHLSE